MLKTFKTVLAHRSIQLVFILALYMTAAHTLPEEVHQAFYTFSLFIKDILLWFLPVTVCFFIAHAISCFEKKAPVFILSLFLFEAFSNSSSVWYAYLCGHITISHLPSIDLHTLDSDFSPLWRLSFLKPSWWSAEKGTFAGIVLGLIAIFKIPSLNKMISFGKKIAEFTLTKVFAQLIPLFLLGFIAKLYKTDLLSQLFIKYTDLLFWLVIFLILYISLLFLIGSGLSYRSFFKNIKNLLPAAGISFSSGCSLSTMPWTIEGTAKNLKNPNLAKAIIPATTNIQQIGDCIANTFLCFLIYTHFNGHAPELSVWIPFSIVFVLARFATAAVLGGAIFVMLPIYESYLGFTPEMIAIILGFNVILDPLITCSNVIANGALCRIFEKVWTLSLQNTPSTEKL